MKEGRRKYIASSFSLQMLPNGGKVEVERISEDEIRCLATKSSPETMYSRLDGYYEVGGNPILDAVSIVGHEGTANALTKILDRNVEVNRQAIQLQPGDILFVAQPTGRRIEYGEEVDFPELVYFRVHIHVCPGVNSFPSELLEQQLIIREVPEESVAYARVQIKVDLPEDNNICKVCGKPINVVAHEVFHSPSQSEDECQCPVYGTRS